MKTFARIALATSLIAFAQTSLASSYVACGTGGFNEDEGAFNVPVFDISSEDDDYAGALGGTWNMKLDNEWVDGSALIKAKTTKRNGQVIVTITRKASDNIGGSQGAKYTVSDIYADEPTLVIEQADGSKAAYTCMSMND